MNGWGLFKDYTDWTDLTEFLWVICENTCEFVDRVFGSRGFSQIKTADHPPKGSVKSARSVKGKAWADEVINHVQERGWISPIQRLFGLHYKAAFMPLDNPDFFAFMKEQGMDWFEQWKMMDESVFDL